MAPLISLETCIKLIRRRSALLRRFQTRACAHACALKCKASESFVAVRHRVPRVTCVLQGFRRPKGAKRRELYLYLYLRTVLGIRTSCFRDTECFFRTGNTVSRVTAGVRSQGLFLKRRHIQRTLRTSCLGGLMPLFTPVRFLLIQ